MLRISSLSFRVISFNRPVLRHMSWHREEHKGVIEFSNGRQTSIKTGAVAKFADGCAIVQNGRTSVMTTAISKTKQSSTASFLPLSVDYRLKAAAARRIPTNFHRREIGASDREILSGRLVDRSIRPMFPKDFRSDTQVVCNVLTIDSINQPDVTAINAASAALHFSDIPWNGPIGAVRVGLERHEGPVIINPTRKELQNSPLDLIVAATKQNLVVMLDAKANFVLQQDLLKAVKAGTKEAQSVIDCIERMRKEIPWIKPKRQEIIEASKKLEITEEVIEAIKTLSGMKIREIFSDATHDKLSRDNAINLVRQEVTTNVWSSFPDHDINQITDATNKFIIEVFRSVILDDNRRCDGRGFEDLRKIDCQVDLSKLLHGSSLFTRGQTQVKSSVTLDSKDSALRMDSFEAIETGVKEKNFFLHYEFPPSATGEIGNFGSVNRREIGHGALAEKGLLPVIPANYPFTIRVNAEVLESNGSSSMATVCAGSMALMDAGVPILAPVAGVAMGLVVDCEENDTKHIKNYEILTDQLGIEDYMGDMDMKVAGTKKAFTAMQMDIKIPGLPLKQIFEAIQKAGVAICKIIDIMNDCISAPRLEKDSWPVTEKMTVDAQKRMKIIGPGGVNVKKIYLETGVQINTLDESTLEIFADSQSAMDEAKEFIETLLAKEKVPELDFGGTMDA